MHSIYLIENGEKAGPFTLSQLREKMRGGGVTRETLGWQPGMAGWAPVSEIGSVRFEFEKVEETSVGGEGDDTKVRKSALDDPPTSRTAASDEAESAVNPRDAQAIEKLPVPRPWRRFWARNVDVGLAYFLAVIVGVSTGALTPKEAYQPSPGFYVALPVAWIFLEASFLMLLGTTPGKYLLGIRITAADGARQFSLQRALGRSFMVWWRGFGLGIAIVMVLTCTFSHFVLKTTRTTPWDTKYGTEITYSDIKPWRMAVLALVVFGLFQLLYTVAGMPPKLF